MKRISLSIFLQILLFNSYAQFSVSPNKHFILRDGKPFFWLGDTGWELFHRLTPEQADQYLKRRAEQGFTVIQAVVLAELDGLYTPNANGDLPLYNDDPTKPNEAYFKQVDYVIDKAAEYNLVIGLLPTWGDKVHRDESPVFTPGNATIYGKWLAERYKNKKNIIWILGGDRNPDKEIEKEIWSSMAAGITEGNGTGNKPLITFHSQTNEKGSAEWFGQEDWLGVTMFQNGHCRCTDMYDKILAAYNANPTRPVLDGEPIYEDHPVCFNAKDLGTSNAYDTRMFAYLELFAGACGHTYGCHDIWQFYSPYTEGINGPHLYWQEAMDLPGANQMQFVKRLMLCRPLMERVPDQSMLVENNNASAERIQATRGEGYAFVYTAAGKPFTVLPNKISGKILNACWYNPRNGELKKLVAVNNTSAQKFIPPSWGYGQDWILILDDAAKNYELPK